MKKILLLISILLLTGCNQTLISQEAVLDTELGELSCLSSYELDDFNEETVRTTFGSTRDHYLDQIPTLFQDETFIDLKAKSSVVSLCVWDDQTAFVLYGNFGEFNNAIGLVTREGLVTTYEDNRGGGDIGLCRMSGYLGGLIYECGGGDGPGGHNKVSLLKTSGETVVLSDCSYSSENSDETVATCTTNSLDW